MNGPVFSRPRATCSPLRIAPGFGYAWASLSEAFGMVPHGPINLHKRVPSCHSSTGVRTDRRLCGKGQSVRGTKEPIAFWHVVCPMQSSPHLIRLLSYTAADSILSADQKHSIHVLYPSTKDDSPGYYPDPLMGQLTFNTEPSPKPYSSPFLTRTHYMEFQPPCPCHRV